MATMTAPKSQRINLRASEYEENLLRAAAARENTTLSSFILATAIAKARVVLDEPAVITLSEADYTAFVEALESPVPTGKLEKLFAREPVFGTPIETNA